VRYFFNTDTGCADTAQKIKDSSEKLEVGQGKFLQLIAIENSWRKVTFSGLNCTQGLMLSSAVSAFCWLPWTSTPLPMEISPQEERQGEMTLSGSAFENG
jgi:hypothetical protein